MAHKRGSHNCEPEKALKAPKRLKKFTGLKKGFFSNPREEI